MCALEIQTCVLLFAQQALYHLSHLSSPVLKKKIVNKSLKAASKLVEVNIDKFYYPEM